MPLGHFSYLPNAIGQMPMGIGARRAWCSCGCAPPDLLHSFFRYRSISEARKANHTVVSVALRAPLRDPVQIALPVLQQNPDSSADAASLLNDLLVWYGHERGETGLTTASHY